MEEITCFLTEYTEALEAIEQKQVEKLGLLVMRKLNKVEQTIMIQQTMDKKLESLEQRRQELFAVHGLDGKTLKEIAESMDRARQKGLLELYRRIDGAIDNTQYYNKKAEMITKLEPEHTGIDSRMVGSLTSICGRPSIQREGKLEREA